MITIYDDLEQGTEKWHELRNGKYTGSNAIKLLKYGAVSFSLASGTGFKGNFYTKRGHILEDVAIDLYEQIFSTKVSRPGFVENSKYAQCGYSPDGIDGQVLLECKCFNEKRHLEIFKGDIPVEIEAQIQFGLMITELKQARLLIYNPDLDVQHAFKSIDIRARQDIHTNFKNKLKGVTV